MFVKERMTENPFTIDSASSLTTLLGFMKDHNLKKVPVVDGGKLVGIVTDDDIEKVSPSAATSLSVYEINYLISKLKVKDAMVSKVYSCGPDTFIEDAAMLMREHRISCLPVVEGEKVVGIITESDLFDALIDMLGARIPGNKLVVRTENVPGILEKFSGTIADQGINISHFTMTNASEKPEFYVKTEPSDIEKTREALEAAGFEIVASSVTQG